MMRSILRNVRGAFVSSADMFRTIMVRRIRSPHLLKAGKGVTFCRWPEIGVRTEIGDYTRINGRITLKGLASISIGKYCAIGADVKIITANHLVTRPAVQELFYNRIFLEGIMTSKGDVKIGNDVWIGDSVIILSGVTIGDGAVVGAGAVVAGDVSPYTIAGGVPARKIKDRFPDKVKEELADLKWWNWSEDKIRMNKRFFQTDLCQSEVRIAEIVHETGGK